MIRVEGLGKRYRLGARETGYRTFREAVTGLIAAPFRRESKAKSSENSLWALKGVSFEVQSGEVLGIIGRNGAGKSTLLKVLSRITEPTEGCVEIRGRVGSLLEVGTGFHPELTGRENIYLNGAILGMRKAEIERKFDEIAAFAEVEKFLDTPVKRYSSGMSVRLAFAVAAHLEPEILLVDEVLAVGDAAFQKKCLGKMGDVAKEGRTVLFVSHNMGAVRSLCCRAFVLSEGRIVSSGSVNECIGRYLLSASEDMAAEKNTAKLPRPSEVAEDETLRITRVRLDTPSGHAVLHTGQPIALILEFQSAQHVTDVVFGWSVHSSDNARLFECRSVDSQGLVAQLQPGTYSVRCTVPTNPLNPGLYSLHVGARCVQKSLDWLPDVLTFRVDSPQRFDSLWLESPSGLVRVQSEWSAPTSVTDTQEDRACHG